MPARRNPRFRHWTVPLGVAGVVLVGTVDVLTGYEMSFSPFYLAPIAFVAWFAGRSGAVVVAIASGIMWAGGDLLAGATYEASWIPYWNLGARLSVFVSAALLVGTLHEMMRREQLLARTDPLTGVSNLREFSALADQEISRAWRYDRPLSVAFIDVDDFKVVNDKLGHSGGDRLLRIIGQTLAHETRATDIVARIGGDEFAILLPETNAASAAAVIEKLRNELAGLMRTEPIAVTLSIGIVTFAVPPGTVDEILERADHLMYEVKMTTKDGVAQAVLVEEGFRRGNARQSEPAARGGQGV